MIYLASPYSHADPAVREQRYQTACKATIHLLAQKKWVYSPIVHCHELAKQGGLPGDFAFWKDYNFAMIARATKFMILRMEGWEESVGIAAEKIEAIRLQLTVELL